MAAITLRRIARIPLWVNEAIPSVLCPKFVLPSVDSYGRESNRQSSVADEHNDVVLSIAGLTAGWRSVVNFYNGLSSSACHSHGCFMCTSSFIFQRSFAAKSKKSKSKSEESDGYDGDVSSVAKESAVKLMEMALDVLSREHSKLRTGRASAGMLDHIHVEAHGVRTALNHIAAVSVSGLQTLNVLPYDPSMVREVEKALLMSPLGLNPVVEGSTMTVPLPRLTKEHCESICKLADKAGEIAKLSVRRARKDALDRAKAAGLSKDELKRFEKEVEELTKKYVKSIDEVCKRKEKEIMA